MNIPRIIIASFLLLTLAAGKNLEWVPPAEASDTTPVINALVDGKVLVPDDSNPVNLPALIIFTSEEPAVIYYTTNGADPTTETPTFSTIATVGGAAAGPTISSTDTILKTLGEIKNGILTSVQRYIFATPSTAL
jgi:uncharacterized membrane protein